MATGEDKVVEFKASSDNKGFNPKHLDQILIRQEVTEVDNHLGNKTLVG